ncbi:DNA gyrase inhibitor YacG [Polymorphobacter multimanifer]|uniref:DNA gyrase inhibitor YacG n=1 Tax=Polymorphobacter multimanifer TaxID=1070431 RepID=A0A841LEE8_9SPHN|nr:DNA gyrase inhibitor YacG [Polymorphobacter multimanifer]MBB6227532.1 hypothetical protein [Polymorphobacter multimanifer]
MSADPRPPASRACAYCNRQPRVAAFDPFCSKGCADRDLLHWLGESYALQGNSPLDSDEDPV